MSLKVWFPFNNTKENKGASAIALSSSYNPYSWGAGTGKTSKECAVFNGNAANTLRTTTKELNYTDNFSWCMWIKPNYNSSQTNPQFAFVVGRADYGGWGYGLRVENNVCTIKFGNKSYSITTNPNTAWYHIAFTKKGNTIITYRNGAVVGTYTFDGVLPTYSDGIGLAIGSFGYNAGSAASPTAAYIYPCYSSINDFRIYDHCLSKKEVREISRALVCHIPLNNISGLTSGSNLYSWNTGMSAGLSVNAGDGGFVKESVSDSTAGNGKCLKIRCTKATTANDARGCYFNTGAQIVTGKTYTYSFWVNFNTTKSTNIVLGFERFGTVSINYKTGWTKYTRTAVATDNGLGVFIFYIWCKTNNQIWNVGDYVLIRDLKLEEGGVATDWCPNSSDYEFKAYGYNGVITDCSGFGNNSTARTDVSLAPISRVYNNSVLFNGTTSNIKLVNSSISNILNSNTHTISVWVNPLSIDANARAFFVCRTPSGAAAECQYYTGLKSEGLIHSYYSDDKTFAYNFETNKWYYIVISSDNKSVSLYINGLVVGTVTKGNLNISSTAVPTIGADSDRSASYFNGYISDFRLYATALSADDVKAMYESAGSVDKLGSIHAHEFNENTAVTNVKVNKNKTVSTKGVLECGSFNPTTSTLYTSNALTSQFQTSYTVSFTPTTAQNSCKSFGYYKLDGTTRIEFDIEFSGFESCGSTFQLWLHGPVVMTASSETWAHNIIEGYTKEWNSNFAQDRKIYLTSIAKAGGKYHFSVAVNQGSYGALASQLGVRSDYSNGTGTMTVSNIYCYNNKYYKADKTRFFKTAELVTAQINEI